MLTCLKAIYLSILNATTLDYLDQSGVFTKKLKLSLLMLLISSCANESYIKILAKFSVSIYSRVCCWVLPKILPREAIRQTSVVNFQCANVKNQCAKLGSREIFFS